MLALSENKSMIDGIEFKSGYPLPSVYAVFLCALHLRMQLWRDDRPQYNTRKGNKARASFEARLSPATLIQGGINQIQKEGIPMSESITTVASAVPARYQNPLIHDHPREDRKSALLQFAREVVSQEKLH